MSSRLGEKLKTAGRLALKVGAVAGLGGLAYLGMKHTTTEPATTTSAPIPDWLEKARAERRKGRGEAIGLSIEEYNAKYGTTLGRN